MLDGADSQYSGMQLSPQDDDEDPTGVLPDEDSDAFGNSSLGMLASASALPNGLAFNCDI